MTIHTQLVYVRRSHTDARCQPRAEPRWGGTFERPPEDDTDCQYSTWCPARMAPWWRSHLHLVEKETRLSEVDNPYQQLKDRPTVALRPRKPDVFPRHQLQCWSCGSLYCVRRDEATSSCERHLTVLRTAPFKPLPTLLKPSILHLPILLQAYPLPNTRGVHELDLF